MNESQFSIIKCNLMKLKSHQLRELRDIINSKLGGFDKKELILTEEERELIKSIYSEARQ
ncbi:hypothetical protein A163_21665 [Vibrio tasmaniensis 1F-267]|uniref:Uncharacterized protein n=1 Tax=Vibrio tasmaniensis 1F-267 TaxID=1191324 RepID=A0ABX3B4W6_9VIBR|nr:hypothetical protein A163_21665 [Vibrio tasmaniensis 1F-267]